MSRWSKAAFYALAEGFWATRVANGLTAARGAEERVKQQIALIDEWYPAVEVSE